MSQLGETEFGILIKTSGENRYCVELSYNTVADFRSTMYHSEQNNIILHIELVQFGCFSDKCTVDSGGFNQCIYDNIQSLRNKDLKLCNFSLDECRFVPNSFFTLMLTFLLCITGKCQVWRAASHACE